MGLDSLSLIHLISMMALTVSSGILGVSIYFNRKSLANSAKILDLSKYQFKQFSYFRAMDIVKESKHGYDAFSKLRLFFNSHEGVWIDDTVKKFVNDKSNKIEDFEKNSPFYMQEPEEREYSDEEIDRIKMEELEDIENMGSEERYEYAFDQEFGSTKEDLLNLLYQNLKNANEEINEK